MNGRESVFLDRKINFSQSTIWILGGTEDRNGLSLPWKVSPLPPRTGPWSDQHLWFLFSPSLLVPRTPSCIQWILFLCLLVKSISKETCLVSKKKKKKSQRIRICWYPAKLPMRRRKVANPSDWPKSSVFANSSFIIYKMVESLLHSFHTSVLRPTKALQKMHRRYDLNS